MDSLKNCPFCGAEAVMETFTTSVEKKPRFRVRCTNCQCDLGWDHWSVEEARDAWNRRVPDEAYHRLQVHNIGNVDIPEGVTEEQFHAVMNNVVEALEHTDRGESWPYEPKEGKENG